MIQLLTKDQVLLHFKSLPPEDRFCRFCLNASDEYIEKYVENAKGYFYGEVEPVKVDAVIPYTGYGVPGGYHYDFYRATGVLHIVHCPKTESVEIAVSVLPESKGNGIGKKLMFFAQGMAEMYRAKNITITGLGSNSPMIKLAKKCGFIVQSSFGEFEGSASTLGADIQTIAENNIKLFNIMLGKI